MKYPSNKSKYRVADVDFEILNIMQGKCGLREMTQKLSVSADSSRRPQRFRFGVLIANALGRFLRRRRLRSLHVAVLVHRVDVDVLMLHGAGAGATLGQAQFKVVRHGEKEDVLEPARFVQHIHQDWFLESGSWRETD